MGMMEMIVVHPRDVSFRPVDRDFVFIMSTYDIDPGTYLPKVNEMTNFNMWTWNSRVFPGIDPLPVRLGDRVRVRVGNLTMTNHPIHLHGHKFAVSCTDGGWVRESAQWPEVTTDIPVGAIRAFDVLADNPGDWALHCHKAHHTMNAMGHDMRNFIGVSRKELEKVVGKLAPDAMVMGSTGMAMGEMEMPAPDNTLPMMTGSGQFGPIEMGGMFTVMKIRDGMARDDYSDPGPYKNPAGTVAYEVDAPAAEPPRQDGVSKAPPKAKANPPTMNKKGTAMKNLYTRLFATLALTLLIGAGTALADSAIATGKVQKIDNATSKVTIKHGPIKALDMPDPMTMVYPVKDPAMLKAVKTGDNVTFDLDHGDSGYLVTRIQKK